MSRSLTRVWPLLVLAFASEVWALGLGDIRLSSALNEPITAEIELLSATPEELDNLVVTLASSGTFERYGLDRPLFLQKISFKVVKSGGIEGNIITVRSVEPVTEPFVTFLVEATWSRGRLLREYTLLLDPPTFAPAPVQESATAVTAPRQTTHVDSGRIERRPEPQTSPPPSRPTQPAPDPAPTRSAQFDPATFDTSGGGDYLVQRGDTLWSITRRMRPDSRLTMNQTMLAILEANPEAFAGNINIMSAGANLRIPSADEIFRINRGDALREVQRQHSEWGGVMPPADSTQPRLVLVPPDDDQTGYDSSVDTTIGDDADVDEDPTETRIRDIEDTLAAHQDSLIEIQDDELAALRQELARLRGEEYVEPDLVDDDTTIDTQIDPDLIDDDLIADEAVTDDIGAEDADADVTAPPPVVRAPSRDEPGIIDRVIEFLTEGIWGYLIGAMLVVLGILVWFARRAAHSDVDDSTGVWDALDADDLDGESLASTERLRALAQDDDTAIVVVEQEPAPLFESEEESSNLETIEVPAAAEQPTSETIDMPAPPPEPVEEADPLETTGEQVALEETFSSETAINLDQSDPVAEADFHMAYGLYDQAADLINGALAVEPGRGDLLAKLCEIYFVWGNRDAFVDAAGRLRGGIGGDDASPEWDKIVIMGQQIAADNEMFSGAGPAPTREVDLAFEAGAEDEGDLDMEFEAGTAAGDIIDLGEDTAGLPAAEHTGITEEMPTMEADLTDTTGEVAAINETEEVRVSDHSGITAQMPSLEETSNSEEMPTAEMPLAATGETPTIEEQFRVLEETGELPVIADDEATRLASLDDTGEMPSIGDDEATKLASLDDTGGMPSIGDDEATRLASLDDTGDMPSIGDDEATKLASLDDDDDIQPEPTAEIELHDLDLDLDGLEQTGLASDLDSTAQHEALPSDDDLEATGTNEGLEQLDDMAATGSNPAIDLDAETATGVQEAFDVDDTDVSVEIDTSLLDATGQTQILSEEIIVETAGEIEKVISDEDQTLLASGDDEGDAVDDGLQDDAATLLAPLDEGESRADEATIPAGTDEGFDFAKTEALPKDVFTGVDPLDDTGETPGIATTDVDLDLDDLTAALRVSEVGDTLDQPRDDATIEHPGPTAADMDLNVGGADDDEDMEPTARFAPDEVSGDLHDARTMTEVGTKLDLARAYVDMGDPGGARSILEEVLDEGDDGQKQQAQQLLESLPG